MQMCVLFAVQFPGLKKVLACKKLKNMRYALSLLSILIPSAGMSSPYIYAMVFSPNFPFVDSTYEYKTPS